MCIVKENPSESAWRSIFRKPLKPRLPRQIVRSAKVNLNRYWHKFEEMMTTETRESQHQLNNQQITAQELTHLMAKTFTIEKNLNRSGRYRTYLDNSLYHGVNLNCPNQAQAEEDNQQNELLELLQDPIYNINFNFN